MSKPRKINVPNKTVRIMLELDSTFVRLLNANVALNRLREKSMGEEGRNGLSVVQQLTLVVCAEARGATDAEVHALIQPTWRPHIATVSEFRSVKETP